jgi:TPR repeat protein
MLQFLFGLLSVWPVVSLGIRVISFVAPPLVYLDAASKNIGRLKEGKRLLNCPPELWAFACYFLPLVVPPLYLVNRRRLVEIAEVHPVEVSWSRKADVLTRILVFEVLVYVIFPANPTPPDYMQNAAAHLSFPELQASAERGAPDAECVLGIRYLFGYKVPKDEQAGLTWLRKSADQNYSFAEASLGIAYKDGLGVVKDYAEAAKWFRRGAAHGNPRAQASLGLAYDEGRGVPQDKVSADMWLDLAVQGNASGAWITKWLVEYDMTTEQVAEAKRRAFEWKPEPVARETTDHTPFQ